MRHMLVFPALNGCVDFEMQQQDIAGIWYRSPRPQWIANLIPQMLNAAQGGRDVTFSTYRQSWGFTDPGNFTLPAGDNFMLKLLCPMNGPEGPFPLDNWGIACFHNSRRSASDGGRFIVSGEGLRHQLERIFCQEFIDSMRTIGGRPRLEVWVRWDMRMSDIAPGVHQIPRILSEVAGLSPEDAARKVAAMRAPTSNAEWSRIREQDRAEKERQARAEAEGQAIIDVGGPEQAVPDKPAPPCVTREEIQAARTRREKMSRATKSKVAADAKDKAAAKAHADKVVKRMEARQ